jgi:hypothetical protein
MNGRRFWEIPKTGNYEKEFPENWNFENVGEISDFGKTFSGISEI